MSHMPGFRPLSLIIYVPLLQTLYELYFARRIDFKLDVLTTLRDHRYEFVSFRFNLEHLKFFVTQWIPELLAHTKAQDEAQVRDHYDRGSTYCVPPFLPPLDAYRLVCLR